MSPLLQILLGIIAAAGTGGGLYSLLTLRQQKAQLEANADEAMAGAVKVILGAGVDLVQPLRAELAQAQLETTRLRQETLEMRSMTMQLESRLLRLVSMIHDPYMTLDRLRATVPMDPGGTNGNAR